MNAPLTASFSTAHASLLALRDNLRDQIFEREAEIDSMLLALIARRHVFLLGEPGVGKSLLANSLSEAIGGTYVSKLLSKLSTYEDVFGGLKVSGIMEDRYERISTGYAQSADILFLDEIWKCNAAVLNSMLTILNERFFDDSGTRYTTPLDVCFAASNELPEDASLAALYDRFLFRHEVSALRDRRSRARLLAGHKPKITARLTEDQIETLRSAAESVDLSPVIDLALDIFDALNAEGFTVSDRRQAATMKAIRASAILAGRMTAEPSDLLRIADCSWNDPADAPRVRGIVSSLALPTLGEALALLDAAVEQYGTIDFGSITPDQITKVSRANREMKRIVAEVERLGDSAELASVADRIRGMQKEIAKAIEAALY